MTICENVKKEGKKRKGGEKDEENEKTKTKNKRKKKQKYFLVRSKNMEH